MLGKDGHIEADLLAYLDGALSPAKRVLVETHLAYCATCSAELARLREEQRLLAATFDAALTPLRLQLAADRRIREQLRRRLQRPRVWWAFLQRRGILVQVVSLLLIFFLSFSLYRTFDQPSGTPAEPLAVPQETLVLGANRFSPGSDAALRVMVRYAESALPLAGAEVLVSIVKAPGVARLVYQGLTAADGALEVNFTVPQEISGDAILVVETRSSAGDSRIERPISVQRAYKIYLAADKPAYRPGQTVHMRALVLDALTLKPVSAEMVDLSLLGPDKKTLFSVPRNSSEYGVVTYDVTLPEAAAKGAYTLQAQLGDTLSERTLSVDTYTLPDFAVDLTTTRAFYAPGDRVLGSVEAAYFFVKPLDNGQVTLRAYADADAAPLVELSGETNAAGNFNFSFELPPSFAAATPDELRLEAEITDAAGQRAGRRLLLPVSPDEILIQAVPESGVLKPAVENLLYVMTAYPDGTPAQTQLTVSADDLHQTLQTDAYGLAILRLTPSRGAQSLTLEARDAAGCEAAVDLSLPTSVGFNSLLLRAERAVYQVGDTLALEALVSADVQTVYLDVSRAEQTVALLSAPLQDGRATFAMDLDATQVGSLELRAYAFLPSGTLLEDTRLVVVDAAERLSVDIQADRESYRPGETAHLALQTSRTTSAGEEPAPAVLGVAVVDASLYELDTLPAGFARTYFLLERSMFASLKDPAADFLASDLAEVRASQDLAARAAWAAVLDEDFPLPVHFSLSVVQIPEQIAVAYPAVPRGMGLLAVALPILLLVVILTGLRPKGLLPGAVRRLGWLLLGASLLSPLLIGVGFAGVLLPLLGGAAATLISVLLLLGLILGLLYGWLRRDSLVQMVTGMLALYFVALGGLLAFAAVGAGPAGLLLVLLVATFVLSILSLALLGQGLLADGCRAAGWLFMLEALLLLMLALTLPSVPALSSDLTRALGSPTLYGGPLGWFSACGPSATQEAAATHAVEVEVEVTQEASATQEVEVEATQEPTIEMETPEPDTEPADAPATPSPQVPVEPYPLRAIFPETLYWAPEAYTDAAGQWDLELPLADTLTTWRLTALASNLDGDLGSASYDLRVFQDFFVELTLPDSLSLTAPAVVTATLFNYLDTPQPVELSLAPADWYAWLDEEAPGGAVELLVQPGEPLTYTFTLQPKISGTFSLEIFAQGEAYADALSVDVEVPDGNSP